MPPLQPFFPADSGVHGFFPARVWAVRAPALLLVADLGGIGLFVGRVMQKEAGARRLKEARRSA